MKKCTLKSKLMFTGIGLHTGEECKVTVLPADADHGLKFYRTDIEGSPPIPADINAVSDTFRHTCLTKGDVTVCTVEHLLGALYGMGIDNARIEVEGNEIPIMDGSALAIVQKIEEAGCIEQDADREYLDIRVVEELPLSDPHASVTLLPADDLEIMVTVDFERQGLGNQYAVYDETIHFATDIAPARTFAFLEDLELLKNDNRIKGGNLDNSVIYVPPSTDVSTLKSIAISFKEEVQDISAEGLLNGNTFRYKNEPARHKLLDLLGDIALLGRRIKGKIIAHRPGHATNVELTKALKKQLQTQRKLRGLPLYNPSAPPIHDLVDIQGYLPHRYPFLMVDKIIELSDKHVVGVKNVTFNEQFFMGHFPGNPIFPGVLQMEALAQTGGILAMNIVGGIGEWDTYFLKMDKVKFKQKVVPGDTLLLKMEMLTSTIRRGIIHMQGTAYVGNKIVSEGELTAQLVKREPPE